MASHASGSWLGFENEMPTERARRSDRCFFSLLDACRNFKSWWRETTDNVILNSPWLHRETGNAFRCIALCSLCATWFNFLHAARFQFKKGKLIDLNLDEGGIQIYMDYAALILLLVGSVLSFAATLQRQRESVRASLFYCFTLSLGQYSLANRHCRYFHIWAESHLLYIAAVLCHSNVHPLLLLLVTLFIQVESTIRLWDGVGAIFEPFSTIMNATCASFQLLLVCAYTQEFTNRVRAVSSGEIFRVEDEDRFESPLQGRSARRFCWLMGISSWVAWGAFMIGRTTREKTAGPYLRLFQNHLPVCTWLALCVLIVVLLWVRQQHSIWKADLALLFCCLTPPFLVAADLLLIPQDICGIPGQPLPVCMDFQLLFGAFMVMLVFMALLVLAQAGCHPILCMCPCIVSSVLLLGIFLEPSKTHFLVFAAREVEVFCPVSWMIWFSHAIDYFKRMRAIRQGLERMHENAASSLSLLNNISVSYSSSGVELQVQHSRSGFQHMAQGPQSDVSELSAVAVAVVRHAERADDMHAFDDWGCSQDWWGWFPAGMQIMLPLKKTRGTPNILTIGYSRFWFSSLP